MFFVDVGETSERGRCMLSAVWKVTLPGNQAILSFLLHFSIGIYFYLRTYKLKILSSWLLYTQTLHQRGNTSPKSQFNSCRLLQGIH